MSFKISTKSNKLTPIIRELEKFKSGKVIVGIWDDSQAETKEGQEPQTILDIAIINHFGIRTPEQYIPPRPFMTNYTDNYQDEIKQIFLAGAELVMKGRSAEQALGYCGEMLVTGIRKQITRDKPFVENAELTIANKGSSTPLVDSGTMIGAIAYRVEL
jgi:hypothetical protein